MHFNCTTCSAGVIIYNSYANFLNVWVVIFWHQLLYIVHLTELCTASLSNKQKCFISRLANEVQEQEQGTNIIPH